MTLPDDVPIVTGPAETYLNSRQRLDYENHRRDVLEWLSTYGKDPVHAKGYSQAVVKNTAYRTDQFYRWVWERDGYTTDLSHADADAYLRDLAGRGLSPSSKAKALKALKRLYRWCHHERGADEWEPAITFHEGNGTDHPQDFLTKAERTKTREAALEYGSIPAYGSCTPAERSRWKAYLAMRFSKPKGEVTPADWDRANGWKIPSLVWTSLDAGLRPIEVQRASTAWVDTDNGVLRIPKTDSSKNRDNWIVGLREQTSDALGRWLDERGAYPMYDRTDALWLTREGNPYGSHAFNHVLDRLCDIADIPTETRQLSWYAIRHSVGTYMSREDGLAATQAQLRHKSVQTTMRYDQTPVEDRKDALDRMG